MNYSQQTYDPNNNGLQYESNQQYFLQQLTVPDTFRIDNLINYDGINHFTNNYYQSNS